jgi:hypothetical protein
LGPLQSRNATSLRVCRRFPNRTKGTSNKRLWPLRLGDSPVCPADLDRRYPAESGRSHHSRAGKASIGMVNPSPTRLNHSNYFSGEPVYKIDRTEGHFIVPLFGAWQPDNTGLLRLFFRIQLTQRGFASRHLPHTIFCALLNPHPTILWKKPNLRLTIDSRGLQSNANNHCAFIAR